MMILIRYNRALLLIGVAMLLWPLSAFAAVTITEVAWMGTNVSANDEWIELHNNGTAVSVEGWQLTDGGDLTIALEGTIEAGAYAVLERTDDTSAPGASFLLYTGALSNSGVTLQLYDKDGALVDQVAGGENWENIGGDNTSKETAQLTASGWITAAATPGTDNQTVSTTAIQDEVENGSGDSSGSEISSTDSTQSISAGVRSGRTAPRPVPPLKVEIPARAYLNQSVEFRASGGSGKRSYEWNFGDATATSGKTVSHRYHYPGNYVVTLAVVGAKDTIERRSTITVLPTTLSLTKLKNGDIQIHNDAKYEIDISGYQIGGAGGVLIPPRTVILPNSTITIPATQLDSRSLAMLFDEMGQLVFGAEVVPNGYSRLAVAETTDVPVMAAATDSDQAGVSSPVTDTAGIPFAWAGEGAAPAREVAVSATSASVIAGSAGPVKSESWPQYAMIGLLMAAVLGVYTRYL